MNNPSTKYVVVYNFYIKYGVSVRHIITYHNYDGETNFWKWYYTEYVPLDGDKMKVFDTMTEANSFVREIGGGRMMTRQEAIDNLRIIYDQCLDRFAPDVELEALNYAISVLRGGDTSPSPQEADYNSYMVRCGECRFRKDGVCELTMAEMPDDFYCKDGRKNG